jgi:organic radical activating enzyme
MNFYDAVRQFDDGRLLPLVEEFYTLQGEGYHTGRAAYFIRIGGCDVGCSWCDTKMSWKSRCGNGWRANPLPTRLPM